MSLSKSSKENLLRVFGTKRKETEAAVAKNVGQEKRTVYLVSGKKVNFIFIAQFSSTRKTKFLASWGTRPIETIGV